MPYDAGMKRADLPLIAVLLGAFLWPAQNQPPEKAVPVTGEPHHHLVYSSEYVRAFDVEVPPHSATMLHEHAVDYIWVALGDADVINAVAGRPEARLQIKDGTVHFTRGGFAHIARNETDAAFRNVTIELLKPQMNPRNICDEVLSWTPTDCRSMTNEGLQFKGVTVRAAFQTDQMFVRVIQVEPGATLSVPTSKAPPLLVAMEGTEAEAMVQAKGAGGAFGSGARALRSGDMVASPPDLAMQIRNTGKAPARFLVLEFTKSK